MARLPPDMRRRIGQAGARGAVLVSVISAWEVGLLQAKRRLSLGRGLRTWVAEALAPPLRLARLTPEIAVESHQLPDWPHRDPAGPILVATARQEGMILTTRGRTILDCGDKGRARALAR